MEYQEIIKNLNAEIYSPVYFLQGEEPFFIDNVIQHIESRVLDESQKSFNQYVFYGRETDMPTIINTARKFPMMGERQVVIIKEAQELRGFKIQDMQSLLLQYLKDPVPSTILVFGYKYKSIDKRTKLGKDLEKLTDFMDSKRIYDNQVPGWIESYCKARGVSLSQKAIMMLADHIGNNLQRLSNEIEKLLLNVKEGTEIDEKAVHKYVGISKEYNVFELQDAIGTKNMVKANKIVRYFAANPGNHPMVLIVGNLFSYFTKLLLVHSAGTSDKNAISRIIGVPAFFATQYLNAANRYSKQQVERNIQYISEMDLMSKGVGYNTSKDRESGLLTELVFKLMN